LIPPDQGNLLEAADVYITIKALHFKNGLFTSSDCFQHCKVFQRHQSFIGIGGHHQNVT
jgi:hypothetical protein